MPQKIIPCLWFDGRAEEAARFYIGLLPDSKLGKITRSPVDTPSAPAGAVLMVEFTLAGQDYVGLNGGPAHPFTEAVSFQIMCDDQAEVDRLWDALIADGGSPNVCSWLKDKFGLSWQIVPKRLIELIASPDPEIAKRGMSAMMQMTKIDIAALERAVAGNEVGA